MVRIPPVSTVALKQAVAATAVHGKGEHTLTELGEPSEVGPGGVAFVISEMFLNDIPNTKASVLVVQASLRKKFWPGFPRPSVHASRASDAYLGLAHFTK